MGYEELLVALNIGLDLFLGFVKPTLKVHGIDCELDLVIFATFCLHFRLYIVR